MHSADDVDFVTYMKKRPRLHTQTNTEGCMVDRNSLLGLVCYTARMRSRGKAYSKPTTSQQKQLLLQQQQQQQQQPKQTQQHQQQQQQQQQQQLLLQQQQQLRPLKTPKLTQRRNLKADITNGLAVSSTKFEVVKDPCR